MVKKFREIDSLVFFLKMLKFGFFFFSVSTNWPDLRQFLSQLKHVHLQKQF